jgi:hypothetical protein
MRFSRPARQLASVLFVLGFVAPAYAQDVQIMRSVGETAELPYSVFYPSVLQAIDDGNPQTVVTLAPQSEKFMQCNVFVVPASGEPWTAEGALSSLDAAGIESAWAPDFPGFKLSGQSLASFSSGPALRYEGKSDNSPMSVPISVIHAEAVDGGRTYAVECLYDTSIDADARPVADFLIANFSTNSDGQCCINPADDRG